MIEAIIRTGTVRYEEWMHVFHTNRVPLLDATLRRTNITGEMQEYYLLDCLALTNHQRGLLVAWLMSKFNQEMSEAMENIVVRGVPILAADVALIFD